MTRDGLQKDKKNIEMNKQHVSLCLDGHGPSQNNETGKRIHCFYLSPFSNMVNADKK